MLFSCVLIRLLKLRFWQSILQAVFKGWSSFKENLGRRQDFNARAGSSDYSPTDDELGIERSSNSTPVSGRLLASSGEILR